MEEGWYFGPSQPRRPTGDSPGIPDGQSAPIALQACSRVCVRVCAMYIDHLGTPLILQKHANFFIVFVNVD